MFDRVLGTALIELNRLRLARPPAIREERFGTLPAAPRVSLVVPLYGRLDFMRCQLAVFSGQNMAQDEIIYVLDQPERATELIAMARSAHGSFGTPFRVLLQDENRGFGPTSNTGLAAAAGRHVLFLNSDSSPRMRTGSTAWSPTLMMTVISASWGRCCCSRTDPSSTRAWSSSRWRTFRVGCSRAIR